MNGAKEIQPNASWSAGSAPDWKATLSVFGTRQIDFIDMSAEDVWED